MKVNDIVDGKYKIVSHVGKGGTAVVYKAININLGTEWAIKEISKSNKKKFDLLVEPTILKKLQHPSLPRIVDIFQNEDSYYIIEDFINGTALDNLLMQVERFSEEKVVKWTTELANVLQYLHTQKPNPIIYRDMKPGNIMLTKEGEIKLIDFGIAREYKKEVTSDTVIIGTRGYAAPEQYGSHQTDERSDIYSLGVTIYHLLTGKGPNDPPFEVVPVRTIIPELSEGIEHIILKCTKQNPEQRYQNVGELIYDLENIEKLSSKYKKEKRMIKLKAGGFVGAFVFCLSLIGGGVFSIRNEQIDKYLQEIDYAVTAESSLGITNALTDYESAIEKMPKRPEGYIALANAYINNLQFDKALELLQKRALKNSPKIEDNDEYKYLVGLCLFSKGENGKALDVFKEIDRSKGDFENIEYYTRISEALSKTGDMSKDDSIVKSMGEMEKYVDLSTDDSFKTRSYIIISGIYRDNPTAFPENGDDEVIRILEKAKLQTKNKNNPALYERLASAYEQKAFAVGPEKQKKYYEKAKEYNKLLLRLDYRVASVYVNLGSICRQLGQYEEAESYLTKLVDLFPNEIIGYIDLAKVYKTIEEEKPKSQRDYTKVINNYEKAKQLDSSNNNYALAALEKELKNFGIIN